MFDTTCSKANSGVCTPDDHEPVVAVPPVPGLDMGE